MKNAEIARLLTLRFEGDAIRNHAISVRLFTKALDSVQKLLLHLTESRLDMEPRTQGRNSESLAAECELFLKSFTANCVTAQLALPEKVESLFPELPSLSEDVLRDTRDSFIYYSEGNYEPFVTMCPNPVYRKRVFLDLGRIAPGHKSDYQVHFLGNDHREYALTKPPRNIIREMIQKTVMHIPEETEEKPCFVSAKGMAVIKGSSILEWKETYDILELDLEAAWRPQQISWDDCHLNLVHPIAVTIEVHSENMFVATLDQLNIHAFGISREEAMNAFSQEFTVLWHEIAQEEDDNLTPDALCLKEKLLSLIDSRAFI